LINCQKSTFDELFVWWRCITIRIIHLFSSSHSSS
jgi:hypothetical protein